MYEPNVVPDRLQGHNQIVWPLYIRPGGKSREEGIREGSRGCGVRDGTRAGSRIVEGWNLAMVISVRV